MRTGALVMVCNCWCEQVLNALDANAFNTHSFRRGIFSSVAGNGRAFGLSGGSLDTFAVFLVLLIDFFQLTSSSLIVVNGLGKIGMDNAEVF